MSKAFKCDSCLELFEGEPTLKYGDNNEYCNNCVRVAKIFSKVDPFDDCFHKKQYLDNTLDLGDGITIVPR